MKVGVIMGGVSSEREVSINTGKQIMEHLNENKYEVIPIELHTKRDLIPYVNDLDIALLALHGKYGEDGTIQGTLETFGIPYTGCGVLASSICMDKDMTKRILRVAGILTPSWTMVSKHDALQMEQDPPFDYPVVVKPNLGGSSIGIHIVSNRDDYLAALKAAAAWDEEILVEALTRGEEITCAILDGKMLPILSIQPRGEFFDYASKYDQDGALEEVAQLQPEIYERVQSSALASYNALKCQVYARVDMIVVDGKPYVLEVNTLPGMTSNSLLPKSAAAAGISYAELLDCIIELSMNKSS